MPAAIALIGGTGPEGRGLATRFALAGREVVIGSRDASRANEAAREVEAILAGRGEAGRVSGATNADAAAQGEIVVITVPFEALPDTLGVLAEALAGKVVVSTVVPVRFERGPRSVEVTEGSAAERVASLLPASRVAGAFQTVSAAELSDAEKTLHEDVLVTGDDAEVRSTVSALVNAIDGLRAVDAGPLRFSRFVEGITILLIGINGRYKAHAGVRIEGLPL